MKKKIVLILLSDPNSISEKIILASLNFLKRKKNNYLIIGSAFLFKKLAKKTFVISNLNDLDENKINFYNINIHHSSINKYINLITNITINLMKQKIAIALINMPLNKRILGKKTKGFTEFFSKKLNQLGKENMLLYSENLAVCPLTTHIPVRKIINYINKNKILKAIKNINLFYKSFIKKKIKIKICGLNPHAGKDFFNKNNEENNIIIPSIKNIFKNSKNVSGPYSADTVFLNSEGSVIVGMYHDQVLPPFKVLKGFGAINITIGLKYLRLSPDHGTAIDILNSKQKVNNKSFKYCINFCEKYLSV